MQKTILLVDDVNMCIEIQRDFLRYSNVEILSAHNGMEAMDIIKTKRPDLVFLDLHMPIMDGAACCRVIKSDPSFSKTPVIMITLAGKDEDREICYSAGCDGLLSKPVDRDLFLDMARIHVPGIDRREKRISCGIACILHIDNADISCYIHDLSVRGAYLASDYRVFSSKVVQLSLILPDGTIIDCHGRIVWVNSDIRKLPQGFGIEFALLSKKDKESLAKFINAG